MSLFRASRATSRRIVSNALTMTTPGRVVDDHVHAGGLLERADVPPLAADDPALHLVVGDVDRAGGGFGGVGGGIALQSGQQDFAGLLLAGLGDPLFVLDDHRPGFLLQLGLEHLQQPLGGLLAAQPAQLVQRLPLQVEELGQFLLAAVDVLDPLGELALGGLDDLLLLAELLGLLLQGVLALVEDPLALVELLAEGAQLLLPLGLLLKGQLLQFQLDLPAAVVHLLLGALDDLRGLRFGVPPPQIVQELHQGEGQSAGDHRHHDDQKDSVRNQTRLGPSPVSLTSASGRAASALGMRSRQRARTRLD